MKDIQMLTTTELENMFRKYEFPETLEESAIKRGVEAELLVRGHRMDGITLMRSRPLAVWPLNQR